MGNKQKKLETIVKLENCAIIAIMETLGKVINWNSAIKSYKLFRSSLSPNWRHLDLMDGQFNG